MSITHKFNFGLFKAEHVIIIQLISGLTISVTLVFRCIVSIVKTGLIIIVIYRWVMNKTDIGNSLTQVRCIKYKTNKFITGFFRVCIVTLFALLGSMVSAIQERTGAKLALDTLIEKLPNSWALEYSPRHSLFVTHRDGTMSEYSIDGNLLYQYDLKLSDLYVAGQGGLMDIEFHPNFESNGWIYFSYSFGEEKNNGLKVIRAKFEIIQDNPVLIDQEDIFVQTDLRDTAAHYGARLAFLPDNTLLITTGDGFDYREQAQVRTSELGKILRVTDIGGVPTDNPTFTNNLDFPSKVFSLGHRNPQGLVVLPNGDIWANEHGPDGGDEVNKIVKSYNYGWPVVTKGKDYIGSQITPFDEYEGMQPPKYNWTPSIAPSSMAFYSGSKFESLQRRLLIPSLKYKRLHSLRIDGSSIAEEQILFSDGDYRMRDITVSKDGDVFILSDNQPANIFKIIMN